MNRYITTSSLLPHLRAVLSNQKTLKLVEKAILRTFPDVMQYISSSKDLGTIQLAKQDFDFIMSQLSSGKWKSQCSTLRSSHILQWMKVTTYPMFVLVHPDEAAAGLNAFCTEILNAVNQHGLYSLLVQSRLSNVCDSIRLITIGQSYSESLIQRLFEDIAHHTAEGLKAYSDESFRSTVWSKWNEIMGKIIVMYSLCSTLITVTIAYRLC
jgi:hypothetical protein